MIRWLEVWLILWWIRRVCWYFWVWCNSLGGVWCVFLLFVVVCGGFVGIWLDYGFFGYLEIIYWYICDEFKYLLIIKKLI